MNLSNDNFVGLNIIKCVCTDNGVVNRDNDILLIQALPMWVNLI